MIPDDYVKNTCRIGQGAACCAYLVAGGNGLECAKGTAIELVIQARVVQRSMNALGDNCDGWKEGGDEA